MIIAAPLIQMTKDGPPGILDMILAYASYPILAMGLAIMGIMFWKWLKKVWEGRNE